MKMDIEQAIEILADNFTVLNSHGHYTEDEEAQAQMVALHSLEAWGKVKGDIENIKYIAPANEQMVFNLACNYCLEIINNALGEVIENE